MKYEIQKGDTLWGIAKHHFGDPMKWNNLYRANYQTIRKEQEKRGVKRRMYGPDWIYPGMIIDILV